VSRRALFARGLFAADSSDVRTADDLRKCCRILPDSNDSGGFFLAVLVKNTKDSGKESGKDSSVGGSNNSGSGSKGGRLLDSLRVKTSSGKHV
jgi:hypothetical protein